MYLLLECCLEVGDSDDVDCCDKHTTHECQDEAEFGPTLHAELGDNRKWEDKDSEVGENVDRRGSEKERDQVEALATLVDVPCCSDGATLLLSA